MAYETLLFEKTDHVAKITLNRPDKMNALSGQLLSELSDAFDAVNGDDDVSVLIITGAGRAFSAGFDISPGGSRSEIPSTARWDAGHQPARIIMKLWQIRQPTIAAVNGHALAAGNVLAMSADIVIASESATFGEPEIRHVAHSPAIMLPYMAPFRHLSWFYYTGDTIDARTAERWNIVNKVVPPADLQDEAWSAAERIAKVPPFAVQMMKRSIRAAYDRMGLSDGFNDHLMLRMIEGMTPGVPEKDALDEIKNDQGWRAFLDARDGPFREEDRMN